MASKIPKADTQEQSCGPRLPGGHDLDILIVGKTGHGKSATANSILGEECFTSDGDSMSVTASVGVFQKEMDGRKLLVVDTPGLSDTGIEDSNEARKKAEHDFSLAVSLSPDGFHAILLVFRYGQRMTKEEVEAIKEMKLLLGENFIRDHGILLVTYGDDFVRKMKGKKNFKTWCEEQKGFMQDVLQECQHRCVLFNNAEENVWMQQRFELIQTIDGMKSGKRYKEGIFKTIHEKWAAKGDPTTRNAYLDASRIYFDMTGLVNMAKIYDQVFVHKMRKKLEELKAVTKNLKGLIKSKIDKKIKEAEEKLTLLEEKIHASELGYISRGDPVVDNILVVFLGIIGAILGIILAALYEALKAVVVAVITVFKTVWSGMKAAGGYVKENCVLQ